MSYQKVAVFGTSESLVTALTATLERLNHTDPVVAIVPMSTNDPSKIKRLCPSSSSGKTCFFFLASNGRSLFESHQRLLKPLLQRFKRVVICICFCEDRQSSWKDFTQHVSPKARKRCEFICWSREEPDSAAKQELQALLHTV